MKSKIYSNIPFSRGGKNKRSDRFRPDKSNFSIYTVHVREIRIPFAGTRNKENLWYQELELKAIDRQRYRILDLLAVIRKPCHLSRHKPRKRNRERGGGGGSRILELRISSRGGGAQVRSNLELDYYATLASPRSFRVNPWPSHWIELNNLMPLWPEWLFNYFSSLLINELYIYRAIRRVIRDLFYNGCSFEFELEISFSSLFEEKEKSRPMKFRKTWESFRIYGIMLYIKSIEKLG